MSRQHYKSATYGARSNIGYLVKRSFALLREIQEPTVAPQGFTFIQYIVLAYLRDGVAINPKDFCSEFRHDSGSFTRVLDTLAERGFIERERDLQDRRKVELRLTTAGRKAVEGLIPAVVDKLNSVLGDFTGAEVQELSRLLTKFNSAMQTQIEGVGPAAVDSKV